MTKNEERNITAALSSVRGFGEVFVVDSQSSDRTPHIAGDAGARVVQFTWNGRYPKKKQWCLENLPFSFDWVLYLDADEVVTPRLGREISQVLNAKPTAAGFFIGLDYVFMGRVLRHGHRVYKIALVSRQRARFPDYDDLDATNMWEVEGHYQPVVEGDVAKLRGRIEHRDHDDLFHYFERHNKYSDWEAVLIRKGELAPSHDAGAVRNCATQVFRRLPFKAPMFFAYDYIAKLGFLDGRAGLHYALAKSFYYWQTGIKAKEGHLQEMAR